MMRLPCQLGGRAYWMLMSSLPHLPDFERANRLPIGPERLAARLHLLDPADLERVHALEALLAWRQPSGDEAGDTAAWYERAARWQAREPDVQVHSLVTEILSRRALMAALRHRQAGLPAPASGERCGPGPWMAKVVRTWNEPHFGLAQRLPWLVQARERLQQGDALGLERLTTRLDWTDAARLRRRQPVAGSAVLAYRLQWQLLHRWLQRDPAVARARLLALAAAARTSAPVQAMQS